MKGCRPFTDIELDVIEGAYQKCRTFEGMRDAALFGVGVRSAYRISELLSLNIGNFINNENQFFDRLTVARQHMKGARASRDLVNDPKAVQLIEQCLRDLRDMGYLPEKQDYALPESNMIYRIEHKKRKKMAHSSRSVALHPVALEIMQKWLKQMHKYGFMKKDCPVFCKKNGERLERRYVGRRLKNFCAKLGITDRINTHSMRKTVARKALEYALRERNNGEPIDVLRTVQEVLGHSNINSTTKYLSFDSNQTDDVVLNMWEK